MPIMVTEKAAGEVALGLSFAQSSQRVYPFMEALFEPLQKELMFRSH